MNEPTLTDTELAETILAAMEALGIEDATILDTRKIVAENVAPFVAARVAEAVDEAYARGFRHAYKVAAEAVGRERAAWATKIERLIARYDNPNIWGGVADRLRALLAADDTEGTP